MAIQFRTERRRRRKRIDRSPGFYEKHEQQLAHRGFIQPVFARNTEHGHNSVWRKWTKYCKQKDRDPEKFLRAITKDQIMTFWKWVLDQYTGVRKASTLETYWKAFKSIYTVHTHQKLDANTSDQVNRYFARLEIQYRLDKTKDEHGTLSIDDLLLVLHYHWVLDTEVFPDEEQRVLLALLMLFAAYTGSRPCSLVDTEEIRYNSQQSCYPADYNDEPLDLACTAESEGAIEFEDDTDEEPPGPGGSLKEILHSIRYKHITILAVRVGDRSVLAMQVTIMFTKNQQKKPQPKTFKMFQHPNPLLCPVAHVIAIGLHNKAFCDPILQDPGKIWRAKIPTRKLSKIFRWRDDKLTEPIFREPRRNGRPSETPVPMRGLTARRYLRRLGHAAGFEDTLTQKCLRRGTGNAVDAVATAAERDQVMGHSHSDIFQFYINPRVRCDVQAAYLDEPSDRALMKVLGRMSLTYDPLAPKRLSAEDSRAVGQNPRVVELRQKRDRLSAKIKELKGLGGRLSPSQEMQASLAEQRKELNAALVRERQRLRDHAGRRARQRYFRENDTTELEEKENREGDGPPGQDLNRPSDTYRLQERARIAKVLCKPYGQLSEPRCLDQRIEFVQTLTKLCARKEARRRDPPAPAFRDVPVAQEPPVDLAAPPLACDPRQCLFCLGDERCADSQRPFRFCRPSKMRDHLARFHLKEFTAPEIQCPHPICKKDRTTLHGTMHFCRHCQSVHGIRLRLPLEAS